MVNKILNYPIIQICISLMIILGAAISIFTPNYYLFLNGSHFAVQIMLGYLLLGFAFLLFKQPKLTFTSFACCAGLCFFLKETTNAEMKIPVISEDQAVLNVAHFNLSGSVDDYNEVLNIIKSSNADIISIQELTPDWLPLVKEKLSNEYPYNSSIVRVDPYGLAIFAKHDISNLDTFYYEDIPNISGLINIEGNAPIQFIAGHTTPPLYQSAYNKMQGHLKMIASNSQEVKSPLLVLGDFYAPPWCSEIQELKNAAQLIDSRRSAQLNIGHLFENPVDYILHSDQLTCVGFTEVINDQEEHLGIQGAYQFKIIE